MEYIPLSATKTSRWIWVCFAVVACVMVSVLWELRFPRVIKADMVLNSRTLGENRAYYINLALPEKEVDYIHPGQLIQLRLDDYPFGRFGYVQAVLKKIASRHNRDLTVEIGLPDGLTTIRKKNITYDGANGLKGNAVILAENTRLLDRLYNSVNVFK